MTPDATARPAQPAIPGPRGHRSRLGCAPRPTCPNPPSRTTRPSRSSAPRTRPAATSPATSPCGWPSRTAARRWRSPGPSPRTSPPPPRTPPRRSPRWRSRRPASSTSASPTRALAATAQHILRNPATWGRTAAAHPEHINVEFVSANPTGPLHIGNARGAFTGDLLCRVLAAAGHKVDARVLLQRLRQPGQEPRRVGRGHPRRLRDPRGRLPRRLRLRHGAASCRPRSWRRPRSRARIPPGRSAGGRPSRFEPASRPASSTWAAISTSGARRARSTTTAGSRRRSIDCGPPATSTRRTARSSSDRPGTATTRIGSSCARPTTRRPPTSRPTSATSSRSSAAATSASSSSGARTTTATWPGSRPRPSRSASTATTSR